MTSDGLNQVRCIDCSKFSLKERVALWEAKEGRGRCLDRDIASPIRFLAKVDRECEKHAQATIETVRARVDWLQKQKGMA